MKITMEINTDDPMMAVMTAESLVAQLRAGTQQAKGEAAGSTFWEITTDPDDYEHGDYTDAEGNLLHIRNDHVVSVTHAKEGADQTNPNMPVWFWIHEHGEVQLLKAEEHEDAKD